MRESGFPLADGLILSEMFKIRRSYVRKEEIRIAVGTWIINGDKNRELDHEYPSILDAWILDGPENMSANLRKANAIETKGSFETKTKCFTYQFDLFKVM